MEETKWPKRESVESAEKRVPTVGKGQLSSDEVTTEKMAQDRFCSKEKEQKADRFING